MSMLVHVGLIVDHGDAVTEIQVCEAVRTALEGLAVLNEQPPHEAIIDEVTRVKAIVMG